MSIFLDDSNCGDALFPFTHTRHVADIRLGILTLREKWELLCKKQILTEPGKENNELITVPANIIPTTENIQEILELATKDKHITASASIKILHHPWQIFQLNGSAIKEDFELLSRNRISEVIDESNKCIAPKNIFIEVGANVQHCFLNASEGPIYIGKNVLAMEGSAIRGPFAACEGSVIKMGAKIYGGTTLGPYCVAGGEIKNSVLFGYSNKAHDGYLGDSVIGEWCNLGAGTSNSNVKNTGGPVKYTLHEDAVSLTAGIKGGLLMGDYSRCAINTSFNTGSVVGVCCNIFGEMPPKYLPHFSWGTGQYIFEKALDDINNWKKMKGHILSEQEKETLQKLYLSQYKK